MTGGFLSSSTHPPLPPTTEELRFSHLRLLRSRRVGAATYHRLLTEHGTAQNALAALPEVARAAGADDYRICPENIVEAELANGRRNGATLLLFGHEGYPAALMQDEDAPPSLWVVGRTELLARGCLSMVGARNASALGMRTARGLAESLGQNGHIIVSGLARGIDAAAHDGALATGTIAVLAGGVDVLYPAENASLAEKIGQEGLRISEQPMGFRPFARHFPQRNRIIAALGRACIVVEAAPKSGSLTTAREALDRGRDVLAVPGHPYDSRAAGCNMLIRDGATLIRGAEDVEEALAPIAPAPNEANPETDAPPAAKRTRRGLLSGIAKTATTRSKATPPSRADTAALHQQILGKLGPVPLAEDELARALSTRTEALGPLLTELELNGRIIRDGGGMISRRG